MKKTGTILAFALFLGATSCSEKKDNNIDVQTEKAEKKQDLPKIYHPEDDAKAKIEELVKQAQVENKNIILQIGGNWCIWCLRFNNFVQTNPELKKIVDNHYLYYHLNYSKENKNEDLMEKYGNPGEKYGFPVFVILDKDGKQIHTQDSLLFEGKGEEYYDFNKVKDFLNQWIAK